MGSVKDRNGVDLIEAEDIEEVARIHRRTAQKDLHNPDNPDSVITYLGQTSWNVKSSGP